jgi:hypothetical protein
LIANSSHYPACQKRMVVVFVILPALLGRAPPRAIRHPLQTKDFLASSRGMS